jgi:lipopolysaccharide/colanic/teichoic acid biosynthesis glycosyltransferase
MRDVRDQQLFRRVHEHDALDMRRLADVVIASILLAITAPLMLLVALAIRAESPGPILERETCIGRGRGFQMLKFRTIVHDPEHTIPVWAHKTTQLGRVLRHTRIEMLPQLINVLRGEVSIMDPRGSPSFLD